MILFLQAVEFIEEAFEDNNLEETSLNLFNPLNRELSCLRNEILSSLLKILETNLK